MLSVLSRKGAFADPSTSESKPSRLLSSSLYKGRKSPIVVDSSRILSCDRLASWQNLTERWYEIVGEFTSHG